MKKLFFALILSALTSCAAQIEVVQGQKVEGIADVVVSKYFTPLILRNVTIIDVQEDFCVYIENGVIRTVQAPFEIIYHEEGR